MKPGTETKGWFHMGRVLAGFVLASLLALGPAHADMKAFNAAVRAGDYKTAAVEAKGAWATFDKTSADTAVVAREFGFASYVAGDYAAAREYGLFLKEQGAKLPAPDDQPATSAVLLAAAELRLSPSAANRTALAAALEARKAATGIDNTTVLAAEALYRAEWAAGAWSKAQQAAGMAAELLGRAGAPLAAKTVEARTYGAAANFLSSPRREDYEEMADAHDAIIDVLDATADDAHRVQLSKLRYQAEAWAQAIAATVASSSQIGSNIPKDVKWRELKQPKTEPVPMTLASGGKACVGRFDPGRLKYPSVAEYRGFSGAVIVRLSFDATGRVKESEVLASVPLSGFAETVSEAAASFKLSRGPGDEADCTLAQNNRVLRIMFRFM